ncbi:PREDICTED: protein FRG2-like-1 [Odobenus rosmarus divergens]|uniref:Protein FRG2-like-1 n=1 Tax=Odobenus rosmarus divergens TaxID=9708 RepID=A0A2U3WLN1_ODORO|nr:PREDICTED: protein FRG2-like-1 [Odobenus rosmarus divergens]
MDSGTEGSDPRSPSMRHPTDQPPCQQNSFKERGSDVAEKPLEGKEETFSSPLRESCAQRQGSEPKTNENSKETELKRDSGISGSESEGCSSSEGSRKRKISSSDSTCDGAGACLADERSVTPGKKKRRAPDEDHGSESEETADARPRRRWAQRGGRSRRSRYRSPGHPPPPLRKTLVTALRSLSEAIYQDVARACEQQEHSPLTWEQRSGLGELWGPLYAALQTVYAMANQAAYVFPAESWLVPGPLPGPGAPAGGGEARGSPGEGYGPAPPRGRARLPELG